MRKSKKQKQILAEMGINIDEIVDTEKEPKSNANESNANINVIRISEVNTSNKLINKIQKRNIENINATIRELKDIDPDYPYTAVKLMTTAELQLYHFMKNNICRVDVIEILAKVRVADIINVDWRLTRDSKKRFLYSITNKHVDFLICDKSTMDVICVVELDDYTHDAKERQNRDEFVMRALKAAGIKTYRIKVKIATIEKSDLRDIEKEINTYFAPDCPVCGEKMVPKENRKNKHRFYGCSSKECKCTIDIDTVGENLP